MTTWRVKRYGDGDALFTRPGCDLYVDGDDAVWLWGSYGGGGELMRIGWSMAAQIGLTSEAMANAEEVITPRRYPRATLGGRRFGPPRRAAEEAT